MELLKQINQDYKKALKEKKSKRKDTLRLIRNAIEQKEIAKGKEEELKKEDVIEVLNKQAEQRKESIEQYEEAGRDELVKKEKEELELIEKYLPEPLSESEIEAKVTETIEQIEAQGLEDMGKVMGKVMPKVKGKADGNKVKEIVKNKLS